MDAPKLTLRIGLTGGIGSGKTTVATLLEQQGATIVDTDLIARQMSSPGGAAIEAIARTFGADFIDSLGALDRMKMRKLAFSDALARQRLEAILHPLIGAECERQAGATDAPLVVFDVPLLVESRSWRARVDKVLVVDCRESTQVARVVARSGWTVESVNSVIEQQAPRQLRRACADAVLYNDAITLVQLGARVVSVLQNWRRAPR